MRLNIVLMGIFWFFGSISLGVAIAAGRYFNDPDAPIGRHIALGTAWAGGVLAVGCLIATFAISDIMEKKPEEKEQEKSKRTIPESRE